MRVCSSVVPSSPPHRRDSVLLEAGVCISPGPPPPKGCPPRVPIDFHSCPKALSAPLVALTVHRTTRFLWVGSEIPTPIHLLLRVSESLFDLKLTVQTIFLKNKNTVVSVVERNFERAVYVSVRKHLGTRLLNALLAFVKFPWLRGPRWAETKASAGRAPSGGCGEPRRPESGFSEAPPSSYCGQLQAAFSLPASVLTSLLSLASASLIRTLWFHSG